MMKYSINKEYVLNTAKRILEFDSPTGFCFDIIKVIEEISKSFGYKFETTNKGCGIITIPGKSNDKVIGLAAHVDTLGAMVRSITNNGTLKFTLLGGPIPPTLDSEYCKIRTRDGRIYTGTFLSTSPAAHVYPDSKEKKRDPENMEVRIDEKVLSKKDVEELGICPGDFIFIDPKTTITESGFIKSRFIDDKGSVAALMGLLEIFNREKITPKYTSICAKDSGGPYDYNMVTSLIELAKENDIKYAVDIYPMYGSDVGAALRGGNDIRGALIGPGVHASHGMERTHYEGLENTIKLLVAYLMN